MTNINNEAIMFTDDFLPEDFFEGEEIQPDNEIIAYIEGSNGKDGKAIVRVDGKTELYYVQIPEEFVREGCFIDNSDLTPLSKLSPSEKSMILINIKKKRN